MAACWGRPWGARGQGGNFTFRYVITSSATALSRFGWEEMTPLEINRIIPQDKAVNAPRVQRGIILTNVG